MRESNFAFPAQNKACVCITSQLYDRRALDTSSALPLFNSLQHLTYLTSTSPRIREIMTMDGGLERLVRMLHEFCLAPPPAASPAAFYGLLPANFHPPRPPAQLNPPAGQFDKHAASRFSLAFRCVVNIGVRGSEPIRSRVVQAGTLDVVGCILEAWLAGRGFAVGPSTSATGLPRETREARAARRAAAAAAGRGRAEPDPNPRLAITTNPSPIAGMYVSPDAHPSTGSASLRPNDEDDLDATTPVVRDRSATVVVRRRTDHVHARENTNAYASASTSTHTTPHSNAQITALYTHARPPASPSASSTTSTTSARGSPTTPSRSGASTGARTSPASSRPGSAISSTASAGSSRASPSPSPSETDDSYAEGDGDGDGDVEMVAAGVAGLGVGVNANNTVPHMLHHGHGRGRVGDSSASASPSPPPLNRGLNMNMTQADDAIPGGANWMMGGNIPMNMMGANMPMNMMNANMLMGGGMEGLMGLNGLNRDPRIAGEEGGVGMGMGGMGLGIGGDEAMGMEGDALLNMGMMMNPNMMMGMDGGMAMGLNMGMDGGMPMMMGGGMGMGMNMLGGGMGMPMPLPRGMDTSGSAGGDSEARGDTDAEAEAEESDSNANVSTSSTSNSLGGRRRGDDDTQTQTPRAGVVRLPSPSPSPTSPIAGPSSISSSASVYEEDLADDDEEEGEVSAAHRSTMRRAGTVRASVPVRPSLPEAPVSASALEATRPTGGASVGRTHSLSYRERADTARPPASSISAPLPTPMTPASNSQQHQTPGAPRVPPAPTPPVRRRDPEPAPPTTATAPTLPSPLPPTAPRTRDRDVDRERHQRDRDDRHHAHSHHHTRPAGPYCDEDVLLSLQLLAYLSKYPHVRQAFYKRRHGFHPASALALAAAKEPVPPKAPEIVREGRAGDREREKRHGSGSGSGTQHPFFRAFGGGGSKDKDKERDKGKAAARASTSTTSASASNSTAATGTGTGTSSTRALETNVFSLVERFTFRPSSSETDLPNPPPKLPQEIQYWAGVIMRNACRKDDSRGGIRQCANMLCGRWEEYPREFAKCRRCRKAKYCGKECQSTAWSEGHRFWCSAREGDDAPDASAAAAAASNMTTSASNATIMPDVPDPSAIVPVGAERRERRARERERIAAAAATANALLGGNGPVGGTTAADATTVRGFRSAGILGAHPNTVSAVFGGAPAPTTAPAGPSRERTVAPVAPAESTRTRTMALLRRTANPLGAVGTPAPPPAPAPQRRETNSSYAAFDTYMTERRRAETSAAASSSTGGSPAVPAVVPNYLHHPQPQNPADIDRYLASFASPPRRRMSGPDASSTRSGGTSGSGSGTTGDPDDMVLE